MHALGAAYAGLLAGALLIGLVGLGRRLLRWWRTPQPWLIPITPAPATRLGAAGRLLAEALWFPSLFRASRWSWAFGWIFHLALALVVLGHLRFFTSDWWQWLPATRFLAPWVGAVLLGALLGLWARRLLVARVRYVSAPSDHLMLALLVGIALSGLLIPAAGSGTALAVRAYLRGLFELRLRPLPEAPAVLAHLALVAILVAVFPFSKLLHGPGLFFAPTRYQRDPGAARR